MSRTIQVFEHETLTLHEDQWGQRLTQDELSRLYEFNDKYENSYFTGIRNGIKLGSYVGVIQIGGLTLEILPKVDKRKEQSIAEHEPYPTRGSNEGSERDRGTAVLSASQKRDATDDGADQRRHEDDGQQGHRAHPGAEGAKQLEVAVAHALLARHPFEHPEHGPQAGPSDCGAQDRIGFVHEQRQQ